MSIHSNYHHFLHCLLFFLCVFVFMGFVFFIGLRYCWWLCSIPHMIIAAIGVISVTMFTIYNMFVFVVVVVVVVVVAVVVVAVVVVVVVVVIVVVDCDSNIPVVWRLLSFEYDQYIGIYIYILYIYIYCIYIVGRYQMISQWFDCLNMMCGHEVIL